ncbi:hypothetical protein PQZ46_00715 [bacterium]|jgi:hypothetical protein|nr:hypothetical protein [bacterium]
MSSDPLNTSSIQMFLQQTKSADLSNSKEVKLPITQAKNLAYTLGIVMARLEGDLERYVKENSGGGSDIEVRLDGGTDWK